jgi:hypothetical protein
MSSSLHATLHVKYCCVLWLEDCECCVRHRSSLVRRVNNFLHTSHCSSTLAYSLRHCVEQNVRRDSLRGVSQCKHHLEGLRLSPRSPCLLALVHTACLDTPSLRAISALLMPGLSARSSAICDEVVTTSFSSLVARQCRHAVPAHRQPVEYLSTVSVHCETTGSYSAVLLNLGAPS